jgi:uncharacterized protein (TIGR02246 family)
MRSSWIISVIAAMGLAAPAFAQQLDQNSATRQQIEQIGAGFEKGYEKQDAAGIAGLFAKDGVLLTAIGKHVYRGPQEIEQFYRDLFKAGFNHNEAKLDEVTPLGDLVMGIGEFHVSGQGQNGPLKVDGHYSAVYVREGGVWKIRLIAGVRDAPPPPPK